MGAKHFHFKRFSVAHDRCSHKVGTDGVLLGSWVNIKQHDKFLLDIGTGCGLIALMLAQRSKEDVRIDAIEIEKNDAGQARENIASSPWPQRVTVIQQAIESFAATRQYDLIVSNPPYFSKSLLPPDQHRTRARHTQSLTFENLLGSAKNLLAPDGRFAVILPSVESMRFTDLAAALQLFPLRRTTFQSRQHKPIERVLIEFSGENVRPEETSLILYGEDGNWTDAYIDLTKEFYLKV